MSVTDLKYMSNIRPNITSSRSFAVAGIRKQVRLINEY